MRAIQDINVWIGTLEQRRIHGKEEAPRFDLVVEDFVFAALEDAIAHEVRAFLRDVALLLRGNGVESERTDASGGL